MLKEETLNPSIFLMIEDDDDHAELIYRCFESSPGNVKLDRAIDGEQAMKILKRKIDLNAETPNVVMLDLNIPKISGFEVLKMIKSSPALKDTAVIVFTTSNSSRDREIAYDLGVNSYVVKPVGFEDFERAIAEIKFYWAELNVPRNKVTETKT